MADAMGSGNPMESGKAVGLLLALLPLALCFRPRSFLDITSLTAGTCGSNTTGSAFNCSCNGRCSAGTCECASGWKGKYCHQLDPLPTPNGPGLDQVHAEPFISTWGGSVIYDRQTALYHMYASEVTRHCGIHRWVTNSIVAHATSTGASDGWHFKRQSQVSGLFSHEPIVARAPSGEYVVYLTHFPGDASDCPICNCTDGSSASGNTKGEKPPWARLLMKSGAQGSVCPVAVP